MLAAVVNAAYWDEGLAWFLFAYTLVAGSLVLSGFAVRRHRRNAEQLYTLTERLRREGDALARLAVVDERTRMARELHDTIAHGVSVMVLQAGAAEQVLTSSPDQARQAAHAVQDVGRSVLEELGSCSASCTRTRTTARARRSRACRSSTRSSTASAGPACRSSCASTASRPGWPPASTRRPTA